MEFYMKLPRNKKEFSLFLLIVSLLSVNTIAPLITGFEVGFSKAVWLDTLTIMPFIWISVVILVLLIHPITDKMSNKITAENDSFNAKITINVLCNVFMMSIFMTVIGSWIGMRMFTLDPIIFFFHKWPRNFAISFAIELLFAQPIARAVLFYLHKKQDRVTTEN